jgi:GTP-binding protein
MRASGSDEAINVKPPFRLNIERGLEIMADDEFLEITPKNIRLRKKLLKEQDRAKSKNAK